MDRRQEQGGGGQAREKVRGERGPRQREGLAETPELTGLLSAVLKAVLTQRTRFPLVRKCVEWTSSSC